MELKGNDTSVVARAPGKLILIGEYAVLEGVPALVTAVDRFAEVSFHPLDKDKNPNTFQVETSRLEGQSFCFHIDKDRQVCFDEISPDAEKELSFFQTAFSLGWQRLKSEGIDLSPLRVRLTSDDFYHQQQLKYGFGSSAAVTVALLAAFQKISGTLGASGIDRFQLFCQSMEAHYLTQGRSGSGIDIAASTWGRVLHYQKPPGIENPLLQCLAMPPGLYMLPIWTGQPASTRRLVSQVETFKKESPQQYRRLIDRMSRKVNQGIRYFCDGDIPGFMGSIVAYRDILTELGEASQAPIISEAHQEIAEIAQRNRAVYKSSGAGGGDCGIAYATSRQCIQLVAESVAEAGYTPLDINLDAQGIHYGGEK